MRFSKTTPAIRSRTQAARTSDTGTHRGRRGRRGGRRRRSDTHGPNHR